MRPHIDSVLFNPKFFKWLLNDVKDTRYPKDDYIKGLANDKFLS